MQSIVLLNILFVKIRRLPLAVICFFFLNFGACTPAGDVSIYRKFSLEQVS